MAEARGTMTSKPPGAEPRVVRDVARLAPTADGTNQLTLVHEDEGHYAVWLDTEVSPCDGLCIGTGDTPRQAQLDALRTLDYAKQALLSVNADEVAGRG